MAQPRPVFAEWLSCARSYWLWSLLGSVGPKQDVRRNRDRRRRADPAHVADRRLASLGLADTSAARRFSAAAAVLYADALARDPAILLPEIAE